MGRAWTSGVTHPYSEIAGEVTTPGTRLGTLDAAQDAGAGRVTGRVAITVLVMKGR